MAIGKEIKSRIKSVKSTGKITKAMELISTVKMKKAQATVVSSRPFAIEAAKMLALISDAINFETLWEISSSLETSSKNLTTSSKNHSKTQTTHTDEAWKKKELLLIIASDKGLCGAYNINVFKETLSQITLNPEVDFEFATIGKRARDFVARSGRMLVADFSEKFSENMNEKESRKIFKTLERLMVENNYSRVSIVYSHYISAIRQIPLTKTLFPISKKSIQEFFNTIGIAMEPKEKQNYEIEPNAYIIAKELIPFIQSHILYETILEAKASEHASRMIAMKNAKDSANKKAWLLTLSYNKARQAAITKEISEIVGGVESMKD